MMKNMNKFEPFPLKYQWYCFLEGGELLSLQSNKAADYSASQVVEQVKRYPIVEEYSILKTGIIFTHHKDAKQKTYWASQLITRDWTHGGVELKEGDLLMTLRNWKTGKDVYSRFLRKIK